LHQAVSVLPIYQGEVYRAIEADFNMEDYAIGNQMIWECFSTCSQEWKTSAELIAKRRGIIFIVKSQTGHLVKTYSKSPVDCEVMFLPSTKFKITNHYVGNVIALGQTNIRQTSYKMEEKDYIKAFKGQLCVIVELEEEIANPKLLMGEVKA